MRMLSARACKSLPGALGTESEIIGVARDVLVCPSIPPGRFLHDGIERPPANCTITFSIHEKNGAYTAVGVIAGNYVSQVFDHYPSRQEVEDYFISDPRFTIHFNVVH